MAIPTAFRINAWTGTEAPSAEAAQTARNWATKRVREPGSGTLHATNVDLRDWRNPKVGWGLILPPNASITAAERSKAVDAPEPIRRLLEDRRGAPVFRYAPEHGVAYLVRDYEDGSSQPVYTVGGNRGTEPGHLPTYLLIYGSPKQVPWALQFYLNVGGFVGRLDLTGEALSRYVDALIGNWAGADSRMERPIMWSVDHGGGDITTLMRAAIAEPIFEQWRRDPSIGNKAVALAGAKATWRALKSTLQSERPGVIVTTSHGKTGPIDNASLMAAQLGLPVDDEHELTTPEVLLADWQPAGAIWYAHACCSAGSDDYTHFDGLVPADSRVGKVLKAVASLGAQVAPLPKALLGASKPLRAFVGHVEPTFDWTLISEAGQPLTATIQQAFYNGLYQKNPETIGLAMDRCFKHVGQLFAQHDYASKRANVAVEPDERETFRELALRAQLTGLDRQSMVILGDPTACVPAI